MPGPSNQFLDVLNSTLLCLDSNHCISYLNSSSEYLFDASTTSLLNKPFSQLLSSIETNSIATNLQTFSTHQQTITEHEAQITLADGRIICADYSLYPLDDDHAPHQILLEIRPLDRQVDIAREQLSRLQKQVSQQFARGIAHEIKNPLGGIRGAAQLLERELPNAALTEYTEVIISEVDRLHAFVDNMLGPASPMVKEPVNILEVLEHIRKLLETAEPNRFVFRRDYDPSIPEVNADKGMLIQAFLNIALNALQSLENDGQITFKTRVGRQITLGQNKHPLVIQIDIIDNGKGISTDLANTIFLPMITSKAEGTGLGLPIAQEIISQHGGIIKCESSPQGTTFSVILPLELT